MALAMPMLAVAASLAIQSPVPTAVAGPADDPAPAALDEAADPASTALALRTADTRMTVQVTIDGAGPFPFIVDSGATRTVISRRLATLLHLPPAGSAELHSIGSATTVDTVRIAAMRLGDLPARAIIAPVLDEANLGGLGILGIDTLQDKAIVIDMRAGTMSVRASPRRDPPATADEIVVTARRRYGQLVLADADAAGQRIWAIVDTGSMITIGNGVLRDRLVRHRRLIPRTTEISDVVGNDIPASFAPISAMRLGPWTMTGVTMAFSDAHAFDRFGLAHKPAMLIGMDMLRVFARVSIDFRHRTVRLLRHSAARPDAIGSAPIT